MCTERYMHAFTLNDLKMFDLEINKNNWKSTSKIVLPILKCNKCDQENKYSPFFSQLSTPPMS